MKGMYVGKYFLPIEDDKFFVGGVIVYETINEEGKSELNVLPLGEAPLWKQVGWLVAALDRQKEHLKRLW